MKNKSKPIGSKKASCRLSSAFGRDSKRIKEPRFMHRRRREIETASINTQILQTQTYCQPQQSVQQPFQSSRWRSLPQSGEKTRSKQIMQRCKLHIPGISSSASTGSPERWCAGGPPSPSGSGPTRPRWAPAGSGGSSQSPPSCVAPCSPR